MFPVSKSIHLAFHHFLCPSLTLWSPAFPRCQHLLILLVYCHPPTCPSFLAYLTHTMLYPIWGKVPGFSASAPSLLVPGVPPLLQCISPALNKLSSRCCWAPLPAPTHSSCPLGNTSPLSSSPMCCSLIPHVPAVSPWGPGWSFLLLSSSTA